MVNNNSNNRFLLPESVGRNVFHLTRIMKSFRNFTTAPENDVAVLKY
jgi:hypothetical protein